MRRFKKVEIMNLYYLFLVSRFSIVSRYQYYSMDINFANIEYIYFFSFLYKITMCSYISKIIKCQYDLGLHTIKKGMYNNILLC